MNPACKDCRFFSSEAPNKLGICRRFPPPNKEGLFPTLAPIEWCGEFQPQPAETPAAITFSCGDETKTIPLK